MSSPVCPHCNQLLNPPPKRSRKCPECRKPIVVRRGCLLTEAEAAEFDEQLDDAREQIRTRKNDDRLRQFRQTIREQLAQAKRSEVVAGMQVLVSGDACDICMKARKTVFPIETCTLDMLPPYSNCEYEDGCHSCVIEIMRPEYGGPSIPGGRKVRRLTPERPAVPAMSALGIFSAFGWVLLGTAKATTVVVRALLKQKRSRSR